MKKRILSLMLVISMLSSLMVALSITVMAETESIYTYTITDGMVTITECDENASGDIVIPSTIEGYPVTVIGTSAFSGCESLTSITIPDSVTTIGDVAFWECYDLTCVELGDGVTTIGNNAFYGCRRMTNITIPDGVTSISEGAFGYCESLIGITIPDAVTSIGDYAFTHCESLKNITIPDGVTSIGEGAFFACESMTHITIPDGVTSIAYQTFSYCTGLTSITIPDGVTSIGDYAFVCCASLKNITIPDGVTSIGAHAFEYCLSLTSITIPDSVTTIGDGAFYWCGNLTDIYYCGTEEEWNNISISSNNDNLINATIHFNKSMLEEYAINSIALKDMSGNALSAIPTGKFLATVSFTNVSSSADTVIILAQYTDAGVFKGLMYIQTEDVPTGSTIKLSIPVDNANGDVAKLKAFCWESFGSLTPMGNSAAFPNE